MNRSLRIRRGGLPANKLRIVRNAQHQCKNELSSSIGGASFLSALEQLFTGTFGALSPLENRIRSEARGSGRTKSIEQLYGLNRNLSTYHHSEGYRSAVSQPPRDSAFDQALSQVQKRVNTPAKFKGQIEDLLLRDGGEERDLIREHTTALSYKTQQTIARLLVSALFSSHGGLQVDSAFGTESEQQPETLSPSDYRELTDQIYSSEVLQSETTILHQAEDSEELNGIYCQQRLISIITFYACTKIMNPEDEKSSLDRFAINSPDSTRSTSGLSTHRPLFVDRYLPACLRLSAAVSDLVPISRVGSYEEEGSTADEDPLSPSALALHGRHARRFVNPQTTKAHSGSGKPLDRKKNNSTRPPKSVSNAAPQADTRRLGAGNINARILAAASDTINSTGPKPDRSFSAEEQNTNTKHRHDGTYMAIENDLNKGSVMFANKEGILRSDLRSSQSLQTDDESRLAAAKGHHPPAHVLWAIRVVNKLLMSQIHGLKNIEEAKLGKQCDARVRTSARRVVIDSFLCVALILHEYRCAIAIQRGQSEKFDVNFASHLFLSRANLAGIPCTAPFAIVDHFDDSADALSLLQFNDEPIGSILTGSFGAMFAECSVFREERMQSLASCVETALLVSQKPQTDVVSRFIQRLYTEPTEPAERIFEWLKKECAVQFGLSNCDQAATHHVLGERSSALFLEDLLIFHADELDSQVKLFELFLEEFLCNATDVDNEHLREGRALFVVDVFLKLSRERCGRNRSTVTVIKRLINSISDGCLENWATSLLSPKHPSSASNKKNIATPPLSAPPHKLRKVFFGWLREISQNQADKYAEARIINTPRDSSRIVLSILPHKLPVFLPATYASIEIFARTSAVVCSAVVEASNLVAEYSPLETESNVVLSASQLKLTSVLNELMNFVIKANPNGLVAACSPSDGVVPFEEAIAVPYRADLAQYGCPERKRRAELLISSLVSIIHSTTIVFDIMGKLERAGGLTSVDGEITALSVSVVESTLELVSAIIQRWKPKPSLQKKLDYLGASEPNETKLTRTHKFELVTSEFPKEPIRDLVHLALLGSFSSKTSNTGVSPTEMNSFRRIHFTGIKLLFSLFSRNGHQRGPNTFGNSPYIDVNLYSSRLLAAAFQHAKTLKPFLISDRDAQKKEQERSSKLTPPDVPSAITNASYEDCMNILIELYRKRLFIEERGNVGIHVEGQARGLARSPGRGAQTGGGGTRGGNVEKPATVRYWEARPNSLTSSWILKLIIAGSLPESTLSNVAKELAADVAVPLLVKSITQPRKDEQCLSASVKLLYPFDCELLKFGIERQTPAVDDIITVTNTEEHFNSRECSTSLVSHSCKNVRPGPSMFLSAVKEIFIPFAVMLPRCTVPFLFAKFMPPAPLKNLSSFSDALNQYGVSPVSVLRHLVRPCGTGVDSVGELGKQGPCAVPVHSLIAGRHHAAMVKHLVDDQIPPRLGRRPRGGKVRKARRLTLEVREREREALCDFWSGVNISPIGGGMSLE